MEIMHIYSFSQMPGFVNKVVNPGTLFPCQLKLSVKLFERYYGLFGCLESCSMVLIHEAEILLFYNGFELLMSVF